MRNYIVASWNDADQYDYSGEQVGNRRSKSQKVHFNPDGSACVASYADPEVKSKVNIKDKILPQAKRLSTLQDQMIELEKEYKTTDMSIDEYTILRDVLMAKIQRQEILYKKAISVKPKSEPEDETEIHDDMPVSCEEFTPKTYANDKRGERYSTEDFAWLSDENSLKKPLKIACTILKTALRYQQVIRNCANELRNI